MIATTEDPWSSTLDPSDLKEARFRNLRELGLTEYQAKAYLALLRLGRGTAAQVAKVTDVPRNKLYPTMEQLNHLGIVETMLGEAQVFRPLPLDGFLEERVGAMRSRLEDLDHRRSELSAMFQPQAAQEASPAGYRLYHGRANTTEQLRALLREARSSIILGGGAGSAPRMVASGEAGVLRERAEEGVRVRILLPEPERAETALALDALLRGAVRVARDMPGGWLLAVGDDAIVLQAQLQPDDASPSHGSDVCLVSPSQVLASMATHYLDGLWERAEEPVRPRGRQPTREAKAKSTAETL